MKGWTTLDKASASPGMPKCIRDQVLVKYEKPSETTPGGIVKPAVHFEKMEAWGDTAQVVAIGPDVVDVQPGDRVIFKRRGGTALNPDSRDVGIKEWDSLIMLRCPAVETKDHPSDILAVIS